MSRDPEVERLLARIAELESIVENSPDVIARFDRDLRHIYVNRAVERASGLTVEDFRGKTHADLGMPDELVEPWREVYREVFATGIEGKKEFEFEGLDGVRSFVSRVVPEFGPDGRVETILSVARDVTDAKRAEARRHDIERRLQDANKLESLGLLAGGIAHDFNNLLTGVIAGTSLLLARTPSEESARAITQRIEQSAERAADLCRQLLAYAGRAQVTRTDVELGHAATTTANLVAAAIRRNVHLELRCPTLRRVVIGDPVQLQQVVMNLVLNAAEAIGEREGVVYVTTREADASDVRTQGAVTAPERVEGPQLHLRVRDEGRGMDQATLARIFEPFFTTHFQGRGLGLSAVLGTVRAHGGVLRVESVVGEGTTFDLYFPSVAPSAAGHVVARRAGPVDLGGLALLIVDDEPAILDATSRLARAAGIEPVAVGSGRAALEHLRTNPRVEVILLDLTMPDLDGVETLVRVRRTHPDVPVVLMSGFAESESLTAAGRENVARFLQKPFGLPQLVEALSVAVTAR